MSYLSKKVVARHLRKNQTKAENIFWQVVRRRQFDEHRFLRQYVIEGFIVDFYCPKLKLAIEIDGDIHESQKHYDYIRMNLIKDQKIKFYRIYNDEVEKNLKNVIVELRKYINNPP